MKIIFLNIWHATRKADVTTFIKQHAPTTDMFCFQETDSNTRQLLQTILPQFAEYTGAKEGTRGTFDLATYVKRPTHVTSTRTLLQDTPDTGLALVTHIEYDNRRFVIANVHGVSPVGDTKLDTPERLVQSQTIIDALKDSDHPVIIGGDFNLLPEAKSIGMFADANYRNLITDYNIKTTRNHFAWDRYPDTPQYHADYILISPEIDVQSFTVVENEISDHLPLVLSFE